MQGRSITSAQDPHLPHAPLKPGEQGELIRQLQQHLAVLGYHDIDGPLRIDGVFGEYTRHAVEAFQYDYGLKASGIVDQLTWTALKHAKCAHRSFEQRRHSRAAAYEASLYKPGYPLRRR
ncbi:peptidoglycan-binding domain-containing protein [Dyella acidiphila]|uniref:Peptidoglycan-binding protein n=1 Tax=Dyella acidiphila TaxID=2775866 RepID=A0ABR9G8H7_9GAMM|nr:peptidoglycan-binding domain-containing protein [Dyella acidiphila]MBE1160364.1 peptidoglycan-binding protein [Dyella acidiphila]